MTHVEVVDTLVQKNNGIFPVVFGITVANLTSLAALPGYTSGSIVRVTTVGRSYLSVPSGTSKVDGYAYVTGINCDWQTIQGSSDGYWLTQATWYIDPVAGNDENTGVSGHPIKTWAEFSRRCNGPDIFLPQSVTIIYINDAPNEHIIGRIYFSTPEQTFIINGSPVLISDTIASISQLTHGTYGSVAAAPTIITLTTNTTASLVNKVMKAIVGGNTIYSYTGTSNPAWGGTGTKSFSCTVPYYEASNLYFLTATLAPSQAVQFLTPTKIAEINLEIHGIADLAITATKIFQINLIETTGSYRVKCPTGPSLMLGCIIDQASLIEQQDESLSYAVSCRFKRLDDIHAVESYGCFYLNEFGNGGHISWDTDYFDTLIEGGRFDIDAGRLNIYGGLQIFGSSIGAMQIYPNGQLIINDGLSGNHNTGFGCNIFASGQLLIRAGAVINLTTSLGEITYPDAGNATNTWGNLYNGSSTVLIQGLPAPTNINGTSVTNLTTLAALPGYSAGATVRVNTVGRLYESVPVGTTSWTAGSNITVGTGPNSITITLDGLRALVPNYNSANITPLTYSGGVWTAGSNITVGTNPNLIAITPDGLRALVANRGSANVTPLTYSGGVWTAGSNITVGTTSQWIVITPDGLRALVINEGSNNVTPLTYSGGVWTAGSNITVGTTPNTVSITPDGLRALVPNVNSNNVTPLTYFGGVWTAGSPITVSAGPSWAAITPDGLRALVNCSGSNTVTPFTYSGGVWTAGSNITVGTTPNSIAITPDGLRALVVNFGSNTITPLTYSGSTWTAGSPITVGTSPELVSITPDGLRALVNNFGSNIVTPLTYSGGIWTAGSNIIVGTGPEQLAITPDGLHALIPNSGSGTVTPLTFPDPVVYLPGTGVDWQTLQGTSDTKWLSQATWYIDGTAGNDENTGYTSGTPIKTFKEITNRWGGVNVDLAQSVVVYYLNNAPNEHIKINIHFIQPELTFSIKSVNSSNIVADTISSFSAFTHGTYGSVAAKPSILSFTTNNGSTAVGKVLKFPNASGGPAYAFAGTANPAWGGVGVKSLSLTVPYLINFSILFPESYTPIISEVVDIITPFTLAEIDIRITGVSNLNTTIKPTFYLECFEITGATNIEVYDGFAYAIGCIFDQVFIADNRNSDVLNVVSSYMHQVETTLSPELWGCYVKNAFSNGGHIGFNQFWSNVLVEGARVEIDYGLIRMFGLQIFGSTNGGLSLLEGSIVAFQSGSGLSGNNNTGFGLRIYGNSSLLYNPSVTINLTGTVQDVLIANLSLNLTWTQALTYNDGAWDGYTTLVSGIKDVTVPYWNPAIQSLIVNCRDEIGDMGLLSTPFANRSTTGFRINSTSDTDNSTVDYHISSIGYGTHFHKINY
jgi:DNA-binding beta-propeller fold protein YncE